MLREMVLAQLRSSPSQAHVLSPPLYIRSSDGKWKFIGLVDPSKCLTEDMTNFLYNMPPVSSTSRKSGYYHVSADQGGTRDWP